MSEKDEWVTLARIVRPQGRRGEVLADLFTDFPDLFTTSERLMLCRSGENRDAAKVESYWLPVGRNAGRIVLKLAGTDSISDAEKLAHYELQIPTAERVALDDDTFYVNDLIGCELHDQDLRLGKVIDVQFPVNATGKRLENTAALFVVVDDHEQELLVPFVNAFVERIDVGAKQIFMALPAGLLELNG